MEPGIHIAIMPSAIPTRPSRLVPRGNHRMLVPGTKELVAGYLDLLADWAARRVTRNPEASGRSFVAPKPALFWRRILRR
jgi:hypothetical protein